jgi:capsule polysaccharide export protein KpsE/RkpR
MKKIDNLPVNRKQKRADMAAETRRQKLQPVMSSKVVLSAKHLLARSGVIGPWERTVEWIGDNFSFWKFVPFIGVLSITYFYFIAEPLYVSEAWVTLKSGSSSSASGVGALLAASPFGATGSSSDVDALMEHINSPEMLRILDKKFHLRQWYSSSDRWFWNRMSADASEEDFLAFYQSRVEIDNQSAVNMLDIRLIDYTPQRAREISEAVINESEKFMNKLNDRITEQTLRQAKEELSEAMAGVSSVPPYERPLAESRLSTAQQALLSATLVAKQQQEFLIRVSDSTLPTQSDRPKRIIDVMASILIAAALYVVIFLLWQNVLDHRRV